MTDVFTPIPEDQTNATVQRDNHPELHNELAAAANALQRRVGPLESLAGGIFAALIVRPFVDFPAAGVAGRPAFDTVGGDLYVDDGEKWVGLAGRQLGYAQSFLAGNQQGSTTSTWADISGLAVGAFDIVGAKPVEIAFDCAYVYSSLTGTVGGVRVVDQDDVVRAGPWYFGAAGDLQNSIHSFGRHRILPSLDEGTYTLRAQLHRLLGSGTAYVVSDHQGSSDPDVGQPVSLRVMEV